MSKPPLRALVAMALAFGTATPAAASTGAWSAPATLSSCPAVGPARATFPRDKPTHATGRGAVVWSAAASCAGGGGVQLASIGAGDAPGQPRYVLARGGAKLSLRPPLALTPAPHGQLAVAGSGGANGGGTLVQGTADGGPFSMLGAIAGTASPNTLATGYLGDVASASPSGGSSGRAGARVYVERYFANKLSPPRVVAASAGAIEALTVSLDFRTDAILAWRQRGALYAHALPGSVRAQPTQRIAAVDPAPRIAALISDDNRAILAWADQRNGTTSIYFDYSASGVRFGKPQLLERFANPGGVPYPTTSPRLTRLSSESVMLAWSGAQAGHWVVRSAAVDLNGLRKISTISQPSGEALLSDLQPGPDGEALALWSEPQRMADGELDPHEQAIVAARGIDARPGITIFGQPEQLAPPGPNADPTVAYDPDSDGALALWLGAGSLVDYAIRSPSGGH